MLWVTCFLFISFNDYVRQSFVFHIIRGTVALNETFYYLEHSLPLDQRTAPTRRAATCQRG